MLGNSVNGNHPLSHNYNGNNNNNMNDSEESNWTNTLASYWFNPWSNGNVVVGDKSDAKDQHHQDQHSQHRGNSKSNIPHVPQQESLRTKAKEEVKAVLTTQEYLRDRYLDHFNLLGVVTSPRQFDSNVITTTTSVHGPSTTITSTNSSSSSSSPPMAHGNTQTQSSAIFDTVYSMSESISKEIESLNSTLYAYSKAYLGEGFSLGGIGIGGDSVHGGSHMNSVGGAGGGMYDLETYLSSSHHDKHDTTTTPGAATGLVPTSTSTSTSTSSNIHSLETTLDMTHLQEYLTTCGTLVNVFDHHYHGQNQDHNHHDKDDVPRPTLPSIPPIRSQQHATNQVRHEHSVHNTADMTQTVPEIFFSPSFDLTDPTTFESLLLLQKHPSSTVEDDQEDNSNTSSSLKDEPLSESHIQKTTTLSNYLDIIELALLQQVQSKSESFFRETNRFTYLKSLVAESVQEVMDLRQELDHIRKELVSTTERVPIMDLQRHDSMVLGSILQDIIDLVDVKASIGTKIAERDYLGAVHSIQLGRSLLQGHNSYTQHLRIKDMNIEPQHETDSTNAENKKFALDKLIALNKMNDQLSQYENVVVLDLSNDLVETFCHWEAESHSYDYGNHGENKRSKVKQTLLALRILNKLPTLAEIYREKLCDTIRVTIRTTVAECAADAETGFAPSSSATIVPIPSLKKDVREESKVSAMQSSKTSTVANVKTMNFTHFMECLDLIFDNIISLLKSAAGVNKFCIEEGINFKDQESSSEGDTSGLDSGTSSSQTVLLSGAELSHKSISEILRLRKDAHSLASFEEMKRLWDSCLAFIMQVESISGQKAYIVRNALLAQTKSYLEHQHELNMSSLAAALDSEKWVQYEVSHERQIAIDRLCSGRAVLASREGTLAVMDHDHSKKSSFAEVEGKKYRVVWSNLLLIEMIMRNISCAAHFQTIATSVVSKTCELLRLFNSRSTSLVLEAGAIQSSARLKSINAKHLAFVTQCVGVIKSILPHVRAALMAQLPSKQHALLTDLDKIKQEYTEHHDKVLNKFVSILGGIIDHNLAPILSDTDFDSRSKESASSGSSGKNDSFECCPFLEGVVTNTRKMHQVLFALLPQEELTDVFSRILSHLDSQVPKVFLSADSNESSNFSLPSTLEGKLQMIAEVERMTIILNGLSNIRPWDFGAMKFLQRRLGVYESVTADSQTDPISVVNVLDHAVEHPTSDHTGDCDKINVFVEKESSTMDVESINTNSLTATVEENTTKPEHVTDDLKESSLAQKDTILMESEVNLIDEPINSTTYAGPTQENSESSFATTNTME